MRKRIYSILLAIALLATIIPITVLAEDPPHTHDGFDPITSITELENLFSSGGSGYLTDDITATSRLTIAKNVNLCLNGKKLDLNNGNITVNASATFSLYDCGTDGAIAKGKGSSGDTPLGGGIYVADGGAFVMNGGTISNCAATRGGGVYVAGGGAFTMNDGTITGNTSTNDGAGVYIDENGSFVINSGTISTNTASANGGGAFIHNAPFTMNGGTISGNTGTYGAGICCLNNVTPKTEFTMTGGEISGNTGNYGGGVHINGTIFNMSAGTISGNTASLEGGGVHDNGTFNMTGGTISENNANDGGGVYNEGTFNMTDGTITSNNATTNGGGIATSVNVTIGGTANVTGNKVGENDNNLYLETGRQIILSTPASGMSVGITMQTPGQFTTTSATSGDGQYFTSDDKAYAVAYKPDGFLKLELTYTVTYDGNGATSGEVVDNNKYVSGDTFTVLSGDSLVREGYTFTTWNRAADGSDYEYNPGEVQGISGNITLYAQWTKNPAPKPDPKPTPDPEPISYRITEGANSIWVIAVGESPTFRSNAPFEKLSHVLLDGRKLHSSAYKGQSGSTLITLTPEFTATLAPGKHTIEIVSTDGSASTVFYIDNDEIAQTDGSLFKEATMSSGFVGFAIVGLSAIFFELKKKKVK